MIKTHSELKDMLQTIWPDAEVKVNERTEYSAIVESTPVFIPYYYIPTTIELQEFFQELKDDGFENNSDFANTVHTSVYFKQLKNRNDKKVNVQDPEHEDFGLELTDKDNATWSVFTLWGNFTPGEYFAVFGGISDNGTICVIENSTDNIIIVDGTYPVKGVSVYC